MNWQGSSYMLGVQDGDEEEGLQEWALQIDKKRTLMERLRGRGEMQADDECAKFFLQILKSEPGFSRVSVD